MTINLSKQEADFVKNQRREKFPLVDEKCTKIFRAQLLYYQRFCFEKLWKVYNILDKTIITVKYVCTYCSVQNP